VKTGGVVETAGGDGIGVGLSTFEDVNAG